MKNVNVRCNDFEYLSEYYNVAKLHCRMLQLECGLCDSCPFCAVVLKIAVKTTAIDDVK